MLEPVRLAGALALNGVSFRYPGQEGGEGCRRREPSGPSRRVRGRRRASGSGKSTLMRLLLGFETPDPGTVTYDGRELSTLDLREVRRQIGVVLQHAQLMPGDLFSNIVGFAPYSPSTTPGERPGWPGSTTRSAGCPWACTPWSAREGGNLSGGQRQRLLIARAIAPRPRILMLDEATSALDNVTQTIVTESITRELKGVTAWSSPTA